MRAMALCLGILCARTADARGGMTTSDIGSDWWLAMA
jgi:hypothetical protein